MAKSTSKPKPKYMVVGGLGDPPPIRSTVDTLPEAAGELARLGLLPLLRRDPPQADIRAVDAEHPEYGEAVVTRRIRGVDRELPEQQAYLGGRPLTDDEQAACARALAEVGVEVTG